MKLVKYSANGNDFIVSHYEKEEDFSGFAQIVCNRFYGIGADGFIAIVPSSEADYKWLFYNSDGTHASMCGNGARACAHYAFVNGIAQSKHIFLTSAGKIACEVQGDIVEAQLTAYKEILPLFEEYGLNWIGIDTGVPHLVTIVESIQQFDLEIARILRYKYNANVNFVEVINNEKLNVRTYERGVENETMACGTGMAASFLAAYQKKLVRESVLIYPKSNEEISLYLKEERLYLRGAVKKLFSVEDFLV